MAEIDADPHGHGAPGPETVALADANRNHPADKGKLRVFISYSRADSDFADQLQAALQTCGFECVIDREDISGGEDWKTRLGALIAESDTVVFVLSPSSARSEICGWEVEQSAELGKRILPLSFAARSETRVRRRGFKVSATSSSTPSRRRPVPALGTA